MLRQIRGLMKRNPKVFCNSDITKGKVNAGANRVGERFLLKARNEFKGGGRSWILLSPELGRKILRSMRWLGLLPEERKIFGLHGWIPLRLRGASVVEPMR
jgi:hypothetical protein